MPELLPCPFCGGLPTVSDALGQCLTRPSRNGWHIYCGNCDLLFGYDADYAGIFESAEQAVELWNTRAGK